MPPSSRDRPISAWRRFTSLSASPCLWSVANSKGDCVSVVQLTDIRKSYGAVEVLKGVSLSVDRGSVVALIGRSGSGKSTLLRCINGLEAINSGTVMVDGQVVTRKEADLRQLRQQVGIVF